MISNKQVAFEAIDPALRQFFEEREIRMLAEQASKSIPPIIPPKAGESVAVALGLSKTAALCYDRIWSPGDSPPSTAIFGGTVPELKLIARVATMHAIDNYMKTPQDKSIISMFNKIRDNLYFYQSLDSLGASCNRDELVTEESIRSGMLFYSLAVKHIAGILSQEYAVRASTIFDQRATQDDAYAHGDHRVVVSTLHDLEIVDEEQLTWQQVLEFRQDRDARRKYRRLLHWLDKEMVGQPFSFIEEEIAQRHEDYIWALKKHGIKTVIGALQAILDEKAIIGPSVTYGALNWAGHEIGGLITAGAILAATCGINIVSALLDISDTRKGKGVEISFVYEVKRRLGNK